MLYVGYQVHFKRPVSLSGKRQDVRLVFPATASSEQWHSALGPGWRVGGWSRPPVSRIPGAGLNRRILDISYILLYAASDFSWISSKSVTWFGDFNFIKILIETWIQIGKNTSDLLPSSPACVRAARGDTWHRVHIITQLCPAANCWIIDKPRLCSLSPAQHFTLHVGKRAATFQFIQFINMKKRHQQVWGPASNLWPPRR